MEHKLPELDYAHEALEPAISRNTIAYHYGKHHQTYATNLNRLIQSTEFENADLETIVMKSSGGIFNNAAQVWNHSFYFTSFSPEGKHAPEGALAEAINSEWGSFEKFKEEFEKAAVTLFGSGWAWLVADKDGKLKIMQTQNAGCPLTEGMKPLMTMDVWEHAYYLDYQNRRADYIKNLWNILDWGVIESRYQL